ncbi:MAG: cysteine peptidase family C39 domain-containing protein [Myxococcaceae bacterium]
MPRRIGQPTTAPTTPRTPAKPPVAKPDPLAVTIANGTSFNPVDRAAMASKMNEALRIGADVPGRVQDGPTCGLYAMGMVMDFWDKKAGKNLNPLVVNADQWRNDSHSRKEDTNRRMFDVAKEHGWTTQGEMFFGDNMGKLAEQFGYKAKVTDNVTLADIKKAVGKHHPVLIPFDVDQVGNPGLYNGKRAHWAVIEATFQKDGVDYLVATHGWTGQEYVWKAEDFMASVNQLNTSDFAAAPKDITGCLRGKMIEVTPK